MICERHRLTKSASELVARSILTLISITIQQVDHTFEFVGTMLFDVLVCMFGSVLRAHKPGMSELE